MKKTILNSLTICTLFFATALNAQVGIGVPAENIHPSAELEVKSSTKGFLPPRMTKAERDAIVTPAAGLLIYQTDGDVTNPTGLYFFDGTAWKNGAGVQGIKGDRGETGTSGANGTNGSVGSVTAISVTPNANGAFISGGDLTLTPADASNGGVVTTDAQTFAGSKTFLSDLNVNGVIVGCGGGAISSNTANGFHALLKNIEGYHNTANGAYALLNNTVGRGNTANGAYALIDNTVGSVNTANGAYAMSSNITGNENTAIGSSAMRYNITGNENTAIGSFALGENTLGGANTAIGSSAMRSNTTGGYNTAIGSSAMRSNITGYLNTANGIDALSSNITGNENTAIGSSALLSNTTGGANTAIGRDALLNNKEGNENTALGIKADVAVGNLSNATAIGAQAVVDASNKIQLGNGSVTSVNTSGTYTGAGFRTPTGTSSQYLMADGSVSSTGPQGADGQGGVTSKIYTIGLWPELGGYVFRISADGTHGLVAETQNQSVTSSWYLAQDAISNPLNHSTNGQKFMDWRLPTKYELNEMYLQKGVVGGFVYASYWSSTEYVDYYGHGAWLQNFSNGNQYTSLKGNDFYLVRSVRAF